MAECPQAIHFFCGLADINTLRYYERASLRLSHKFEMYRALPERIAALERLPEGSQKERKLKASELSACRAMMMERERRMRHLLALRWRFNLVAPVERTPMVVC
jgi:hypothetical protein